MIICRDIPISFAHDSHIMMPPIVCLFLAPYITGRADTKNSSLRASFKIADIVSRKQ